MALLPVLLAGGIGVRLWPLSTPDRPKQFAPLLPGGESCFQHVAQRAMAIAPAERALVVTGERYASLARAQFGGEPWLVTEPAPRNTALACALAALHAETRFGGEALLWLLPCDGYMPDPAPLLKAVTTSLPAASEGSIVTFGITPSCPEPGFGYLRPGTRREDGLHACERFLEKPDADRAVALLTEGGWLWNSGMFLLSVDTLLAALERHAPVTLNTARFAHARPDHAAEAYAAAPVLPIDIAVMERADNLLIHPLNTAWLDLGDWHRLWQLDGTDAIPA